MTEPSKEARALIDDARDDHSWVWVPQNWERWSRSVWDDPIEYTDRHGLGWHFVEVPRK